MVKKYRVAPTAEERGELEGMLGKGKAGARKLAHAHILLRTDAGGGGPAAGRGEVVVVEPAPTGTSGSSAYDGALRARIRTSSWSASLSRVNSRRPRSPLRSRRHAGHVKEPGVSVARQSGQREGSANLVMAPSSHRPAWVGVRHPAQHA